MTKIGKFAESGVGSSLTASTTIVARSLPHIYNHVHAPTSNRFQFPKWRNLASFGLGHGHGHSFFFSFYFFAMVE